MNQPVAKTLHFKPHERNIFFHLLTACNLSCKHCYINPAQHGTGTVSRETMEQWLSLFYDPSKESNVIFLGGEPTLHPDLVHGIRYARALGYKTITVDSNGFLHHDLLKRRDLIALRAMAARRGVAAQFDTMRARRQHAAPMR